jgi:hypothetical protein
MRRGLGLDAQGAEASILVLLQVAAEHRPPKRADIMVVATQMSAADISPCQNPSVNSPLESESWLRLLVTGLERETGLTMSHVEGNARDGTGQYLDAKSPAEGCSVPCPMRTYVEPLRNAAYAVTFGK